MKKNIKSVTVGKWRADVLRADTYRKDNNLVVYFYDTSQNKKNFPDGQFVSSYYLDTLMGKDNPHSKRLKNMPYLVLHHDVLAWTLYPDELKLLDKELESCLKYQETPKIGDFGKIMKDIYNLTQESEQPVWFLEKSEFETGDYTQEDLDEFARDFESLQKDYGISDLSSIIEFYDNWENAVDNEDAVITFYGAFEHLFEENKKYVVVRETLEYRVQVSANLDDEYVLEQVKEMYNNGEVVLNTDDLIKTEFSVEQELHKEEMQEDINQDMEDVELER